MRHLCSIIVAALLVSAVAPGTADARRRIVYRRGYATGYVRYGYRAHYEPTGEVVYGPGGWYLGAGLTGTKILDQRGGPEQLDDGAGVSLFGGFRLSDRLALELGWLGSFHNPATVDTVWGPMTDFLVLEGFLADLRVHLDRSGNLDPYLQAGVGVYALGSEAFGLDALGQGFQLGGGFDYFVTDVLTLGLRVRYHGIAMGSPSGRGDADVFVSAATVEASLGLHF